MYLNPTFAEPNAQQKNPLDHLGEPQLTLVDWTYYSFSISQYVYFSINLSVTADNILLLLFGYVANHLNALNNSPLLFS